MKLSLRSPLLLICFFSLFITGCSNLLYYPSRSLYVDIKKIQNQPEEKKIKLNEKVFLHGWHFRTLQKSPKAYIVFFHGNAQNRSSHFLSLYWLIDEGFDLIIFDYPGYGQSAGSPNPESTVQSAIKVIEYAFDFKLKSKDPNIPIIVYGHSLGGAIGARAVWELRNKYKPNLLVLDSTFSSYQEVARKLMAKTPVTWALQPLVYLVLSDKWSPEKKYKDLSPSPLLVIHSKADEIIPFKLGEKIFNSSIEPKEFWRKESHKHNQLFLTDQDRSYFLNYLNKTIFESKTK